MTEPTDDELREKFAARVAELRAKILASPSRTPLSKNWTRRAGSFQLDWIRNVTALGTGETWLTYHVELSWRGNQSLVYRQSKKITEASK